MKLTESFFLTRRENPNDEFSDTAKLLVKSGMILKNENGLYSYLPIGLKVIENIKSIIRNELNRFNYEEVLLPSILKDELDDESKIDEVFHIIDRNDNKMKLTHSSISLFCDLVKHRINSYKDLHFSLYQINSKFRDEKKAELALVRMKEFMQCECYSFDSDEGGLDVSYDRMFLAFKNIFSLLSLSPLIVRGNEGLFNEEFQIISPNGDNSVVRCTSCGYTSSIEDASSKMSVNKKEVGEKQKELIKTDDNTSIKKLSKFFSTSENNILKSVIVKVDEVYKMIILRGNSEINIKRLMKIFNTKNIGIPSVEDLVKLDLAINYVGPIDCNMEVIADYEVKYMHNFICGSNKKNYHFKNVNYGRDFKINRFENIKLFNDSSLCPLCRNKCEIVSGIEIGQINKLGHKIAKYYDLTYTNEMNRNNYVEIGSYHIGIDRCLSAIVEKHHDKDGIIWPMNIAPYKVAIIIANVNHEEMKNEAIKLYNRLEENKIETILDDRKDSIGVKLNDIDLIGIPIRVIVGSLIENNKMEVKLRNREETKEVEINKVYDYICDMMIEYNNK